MSKDSAPLVQLRNISKRFPGVQALDQVNLSVLPGEIHAVVGENGAGKSTLINILAGELQPDSGSILFEGVETVIPNAFISQRLGISVVYQELALCPNLSVAENISLHQAAVDRGLSFVKRRQFAVRARSVLEQLGIADIDLSTPVSRLGIAQQQLVEIAKAISGQVKLLVLDEPNSALTDEESARLFAILRQLRAAGIGIIYVSHRLEEVISLADRITVLRDGQYIETLAAAAATVDGLIARMVGRAVDMLYHRERGVAQSAALALALRHLSSGATLRDITLAVHAGEIVGIAGLPDSGKDELVECCFGLHRYHGEIVIGGAVVQLHSPTSAIEAGVAFVPADRRHVGALLMMSVQNNIAAASLPAVSTAGLLRPGAIRTLANDYVTQLDVRISSLEQQMATLSGGNQQKVILGRSIATHPKVLILHEPTRGIDVGAKAEIYRILQELAQQGVGILIASSELPELIGQCDRILVMHRGTITGEFTRSEAAEEPILACAMGQMTHFISEGERR
jgi:ribose transport system ATP-binding protein